MIITSPENPTVRRLKRLSGSARDCRTLGRTLIEGAHLLQAAQLSKAVLHTLVLRAGDTPAEALALADQARALPGVKTVELAPALYRAISPVEHGSGVLAEIGIPRALLPDRIDEDSVYLDGVQDPGNVGTLLRTAAAAGVRQVLAGPGCAYLWSPRVLRAGMGAHFVLGLHEEVLPEVIGRVFAGTVLAADAAGGDDLYSEGWDRAPTLWMFGAEGQGLGPATLALAQRRLRIPIDERVESLNVAAAAAVCLFEQHRRRLAGPPTGSGRGPHSAG
jgi:RNA methyltransferase, TrmH family